MGSLRDTKKQTKKQEEAEYELVVDKKHKFSGNVITVNGNLGRIALPAQAYQYTVERYGKDFQHVQLLKSKVSPGTFLIRPCAKEVSGSRGVHLAAGSRVISAKLLFHELGWTSTEGVHFKAEWQKDLEALKVNLNSPLDE